MAQINKPNLYFTPFTFTGTGSAGTRTGVGFTPDMFIHKNRDLTQSWGVIDVIRGNGNYISTNTTSAELSDVGAYGITTDGYTFPNGDPFFNGSGNNMAYWNWKAGGTGVSNTDGSITSTVSANTTSGFSIVSFTGNQTLGATVGHGLGAVPKVIIIKDRDNVRNWNVYHASVCDSDYKFLRINTTDAVITGGATHFDISAMSSTVFGLGADNESNPIASAIAYCFADVKGFSKFNSYTGNGSADGTFIYTGFKPAFLILKRTDSAGFDWFLHDNKRNGFNPDNDYLQPNLNSAETNFDGLLDFVSNGFKLKTTSTAYNASGGSYIYMCFAENPLVGTNNIPATAR